ncbi:MAG: 3-phosphoshikimate 1-carboxyvinyltransferase [Coriobacteriia bacterium]
MRYDIEPADSGLAGRVRVPGDKSISHRAVLFAAMAEGRSHVSDVLDSADVRSTIQAMRALGATIEVSSGQHGLDLVVDGWGLSGPTQPAHPIDCGNSGTTVRLLMGVLAGHGIVVELTGDESLSRRPMRRVADPLGVMGARVETSGEGTLPARVVGAALHGRRHELAVASAQVKSALLLAGLRAEGWTEVCEPAASRDHTERMLPAFGVRVLRDESGCASVLGPTVLRGSDVAVPGDPSSAAFLVGAALLVPGSDVQLPDVALNPTRTGFLRVLARMGARLDVDPGAEVTGEPVGVVHAAHGGELVGTTVSAAEVPSLIDEIPLLAVVAARAHGVTRFEGVGELRVKESDRLQAIANGLTALGADAAIDGDDLVVRGPSTFGPADLDSLGDHRLAMAFAVAGLVATGRVTVERFEAVDVSYPGFADHVAGLRLGGAFR